MVSGFGFSGNDIGCIIQGYLLFDRPRPCFDSPHCWVQGLRYGVKGLWLMVDGQGFRVYGLWFRVQGLGWMV